MEGLEYSILKVLAYFDVFSYPLTRQEILLFLDREARQEELSPVLQQLTREEFIYQLEGFYTLHNDAALIARRIRENKRAEALLPKARRISKLLLYFPFVRAISISGSLSKNVASPEADIDYFIITQTNRLWIARTLLVILRKCSLLVGKQDWFCLNYYIDESCLPIPEQNIYTATEIVTLIIPKPSPTAHLFLDANLWVKEYYPNYGLQKTDHKPPVPKPFQSGLAFLLNFGILDKLDSWLMNQSINRLRKKKTAGKLVTEKGKLLELPLFDRHYCKHNPDFLQAQVLRAHKQKVDLLFKKYQESHQFVQASAPAP